MYFLPQTPAGFVGFSIIVVFVTANLISQNIDLLTFSRTGTNTA
jgi:hypothetical protein